MSTIKTVLISVSDKTGIVTFAKALSKYDIKILSTSGTSKLLKQSGLEVTDISDHTGFAEIMDGRIKTLHPLIHGGILANVDNPKHVNQMLQSNICKIDVVVVNLYPFIRTAKSNASFDTCIENIDIGGPAMIRSCAKNYKHATVVTNPNQYNFFIKEVAKNGGQTTLEMRREFAKDAFAHTAEYDSYIANWFGKKSRQYPKKIFSVGTLKQVLRYGENPHQKAAMYLTDKDCVSIANAKQIQGKELSYNNLVDADAAFEMVCEYSQPSCAIIKHANPCGIASAKNADQAWQKALSCDPISAFGGIVAINCKADEEFAKSLSQLFLEVLIAPSYTQKALDILASKKNLRVLETKGIFDIKSSGTIARNIYGGMLLQSCNDSEVSSDNYRSVTERSPTDKEWADLVFAWKAVKYVKSNAIVYARDTQTVGIGAGQMSRIDSAEIGAKKAHLKAKGSVVASDAFFPFVDALERCIQAGVTAIIQPGGSKNDQEIIAAANKSGVAMVFTGVRYFKH